MVVGYFVLMAILSIFLYVYLWIVHKFEELFFVYANVFILVFTLLMSFIFPNFIQPLFNKFEDLEEGTLKKDIYELAGKIHFPLTKIYVMDGSKRSAHSNAYFFGFWKNKRIVLFDTLLKHLNDK